MKTDPEAEPSQPEFSQRSGTKPRTVQPDLVNAEVVQFAAVTDYAGERVRYWRHVMRHTPTGPARRLGVQHHAAVRTTGIVRWSDPPRRSSHGFKADVDRLGHHRNLLLADLVSARGIAPIRHR